MRIKLSSFVILLVAAFILQGCSLKARIKRADKRFSYGEYYAASELYRKISGRIPYDQKPLRARIYFQQAECYRLINYNRAEQAYVNAIRYKYPDPVLYLHYAQVLQRMGKYDDAIKNYSIYLDTDSSSLLAKNGLKACRQMPQWKKQPTRYVVRKMDLFNTRNTDNFSPAFIYPDADDLLFTSSRQFSKSVFLKGSSITGMPNNNMFMCKKNANGKWEKPYILSSEVNTVEFDEGVCCIGFDGKVMYYTRARQVANAEYGTEIYTSNRAGGDWSVPQKLKIFSDTTVSVAHPAVSPDGQTLYFVSDAKGGQGGKDIWKAKLENGECKFIENMGPEINTPGDEMFPTVRADGTLFFSSSGFPGYGGLDIFKATQTKDGHWNVENMGTPLNSSADDFGMTFAGKAERGFFSTNRNETKGYDAIWSFELPEIAYVVEGVVSDEKGVGIPDATVRLVGNNGTNARVQTKKDGSYRLKLDKNADCIMLAVARGYLNQRNAVSTQGLEDSKSFTVNFKLATISKPVPVENIFYESGKWELSASSEAGLQLLVKMLKDNPNITIEISANTDCVGSNADNKLLSERRAKSITNYLISKGIEADRLTSVGFGEEKPVVVDAALAHKYSFLKENDALTEAYVLKLTPEQQEIVNQINRRTDFRVLKTTYKLY